MKRQYHTDTSGVVTTTVFNTKIGEVENKIPHASSLVKKTDYNTKISDIEAKYFTTSDYNKFAKEILHAKIKGKGVVDKSDIFYVVKNSDLNTKLTTLAVKAELKAEQDKMRNFKCLIQKISVIKIFLVMMVFKVCFFINQHLIC